MRHYTVVGIWQGTSPVVVAVVRGIQAATLNDTVDTWQTVVYAANRKAARDQATLAMRQEQREAYAAWRRARQLA